MGDDLFHQHPDFLQFIQTFDGTATGFDRFGFDGSFPFSETERRVSTLECHSADNLLRVPMAFPNELAVVVGNKPRMEVEMMMKNKSSRRVGGKAQKKSKGKKGQWTAEEDRHRLFSA